MITRRVTNAGTSVVDEKTFFDIDEAQRFVKNEPLPPIPENAAERRLRFTRLIHRVGGPKTDIQW